MPPAPERLFASDNASGVHPEYLEALAAANIGHVTAYGSDPFTARATARFGELCDADVEVLLTFGGTGANVLALAALLGPAESVVCSQWAHIAVDETGAPERVLGVKLQTLASEDGKITPEQITALVSSSHGIHHVVPAVVSISQPTEMGTLYSFEEIRDIVAVAHEHGMRVHVDGARIANAVAAMGADVDTFRRLTFAAGIDALCFGGTKNAMLNAEAVILRGGLAAGRGQHLRKQVTQLPSKMRYMAAQFDHALSSGLWIRTAQQANAMSVELYEASRHIPSLEVDAPAVNSLFPTLPSAAARQLQEWSFFWDWNIARSQVRWMTSWDTTSEDVNRFTAGIRHVLRPS